jgi:hypothetical protein
MYKKIKLKDSYPREIKKNDPKLKLEIPKSVYDDLKLLSDYNKRSIKEEMLARLIKTLELNNEFMATERLMRMIIQRKFAS